MEQIVGRLSHKKWRIYVKKQRRKKRRQELARIRDLEFERLEQERLKDPEYLRYLREQERLRILREDFEQAERRRQEREWQERIKLADESFHRKKAFLESKREQQEENSIETEDIEEQVLSTETLDQIIANLPEGDSESEPELEGPAHNPEPPESLLIQMAAATQADEEYQKREACLFYVKTGICRFGFRCSRRHDTVSSSRTLMLPSMFTHPSLERRGVFNTDSTNLEYDESDLEKHFKQFREDVLPELKKFGRVVQFKVCRNLSIHLRGNVYVQYRNLDHAIAARTALNGRWYSGKPLACHFVSIKSWRNAVCGLFHKKRCPKGDQCNFLHVFRDSEFDHVINDERDRDDHSRSPTPTSTRSERRRRQSHRSSRSRSPSYDKRSRRRRSDSRDRYCRSRRSSRDDSSDSNDRDDDSSRRGRRDSKVSRSDRHSSSSRHRRSHYDDDEYGRHRNDKHRSSSSRDRRRSSSERSHQTDSTNNNAKTLLSSLQRENNSKVIDDEHLVVEDVIKEQPPQNGGGEDSSSATPTSIQDWGTDDDDVVVIPPKIAEYSTAPVGTITTKVESNTEEEKTSNISKEDDTDDDLEGITPEELESIYRQAAIAALKRAKR